MWYRNPSAPLGRRAGSASSSSPCRAELYENVQSCHAPLDAAHAFRVRQITSGRQEIALTSDSFLPRMPESGSRRVPRRAVVRIGFFLRPRLWEAVYPACWYEMQESFQTWDSAGD